MAYPYGQPFGGYPEPPYPGYPTAPGYPQYPPVPGYPSQPGYPAARSYYYLRSRLNGLVLDVEGDSRSAGARVIMWNQKPGHSDNQLWYDDFATGTIRSKLNDFCLDWNGNTIVLNPYNPGNPNQQWERADPFVRSRATPNKVLDIANNNSAAGAHLCSWDRSGNPNQCFDVEFVGAAQQYQPTPAPRSARRYFHIASDMHNKVMDISGGSSSPGAHVIAWPKKADGSARNQLWYFDGNGIILSALNDFALTSKNAGDQIQMMPFKNQPAQQWRLMGNRIMKNGNECLDVAREDRNDGVEIISFQYKGSVNQHWHLEYV